jgi:hypothetical protein
MDFILTGNDDMWVKFAQLQATANEARKSATASHNAQQMKCHTNVGGDTQQHAICTEVARNRAECTAGNEHTSCTTFRTSKASFNVDMNRNDLDCAMRKRQRAIHTCIEISREISEAVGKPDMHH